MKEVSKDNFKIGGTVFIICWIASILVIPLCVRLGFLELTNVTIFPAILIIICLILFPFLKKFSVGKFLSLELKELNKSIEEVKTSIKNYINMRQNNVQVMKNYNIQTPIGNMNIVTQKESKHLLDLGYSLYKQTRLIEALDCYKNVYLIDPKNWIASFMIGTIYLALEDLQIPVETWGITNEERIAKSIFYSSQTINVDPNHYNQYMNLGIAYLKLKGENSYKLAYSNLEVAYKMLCNDQNIQHIPAFMLDKGKALSFMGEIAEKLNQIKIAIEHRKESINIFDSCPNPKPSQLNKWKELSQNALSKLENKE